MGFRESGFSVRKEWRMTTQVDCPGQETSSKRTGKVLTRTELSVVIVSYNVRDLLEGCLDSVKAAAEGIEVETFVVDNASHDGSPSMVHGRHPGVRLIALEENIGFSGANNLALRRAGGRYVLLLNPDTVLDPDVFTKMTAYMDAHPDVGMVSCKLVTGEGGLDLACRRSFPSLWDGFCRASGLSARFPGSRLFARYNLTYLDEDETHDVEAVNGAFMFVRREALESVGLLDEDYFMYVEDLDWCFRFREAGWRVVYHPKARCLHLKGQSGKQKPRAMIRALFDSTALFYRKHYFPRINLLHQVLLLAGIKAWQTVTLIRNAFRKRKRTRP